MANYIDAHQHFWNFDPVRDSWITEDMLAIRKDFGPKDLQPLLEAEGFSGCVAVQADQSEAETEFLLKIAEQNPFVKGVVGWLDLRDPMLEERLDYYQQFSLLKGLRHVVQSEPDDQFMLREDFMKGITALKHYDLKYDILIYPKHLPAALQLVARNSYQPFVVDHIAKPYIKDKKIEPWASNIRALAAYPNVYCKLSGMVTEADWKHWNYDDFVPYLDVVLQAFTPGRLMIGSDWPVCLLGGEYSKIMGIVRKYVNKLSQSEQNAILGGNADRFYSL